MCVLPPSSPQDPGGERAATVAMRLVDWMLSVSGRKEPAYGCNGLWPTAACRQQLKLLRAGVHDGPQLGAVLEVLHLRGEPAVLLDPILHALRIDRHQLGGSGVARHPDAGRPAFVEIGLVEAHAGLGGGADAVERHDSEHEAAGGIADAVDDDPLPGIAKPGVFRLVFLDVAAEIARDAVVGERRRGRGDEQNGSQNAQCPTPNRTPTGTLARKCKWLLFSGAGARLGQNRGGFLRSPGVTGGGWPG